MSLAVKSAISTALMQTPSRADTRAWPRAASVGPADRVDIVPAAANVLAFPAARGDAPPFGQGLPNPVPSMDSRYVKFVEAVQALRLDVDVTTMTRAQIERMMQSARDIFMLDDGIPGPVEPSASGSIADVPEQADTAETSGDAEPVAPEPALAGASRTGSGAVVGAPADEGGGDGSGARSNHAEAPGFRPYVQSGTPGIAS